MRIVQPRQNDLPTTNCKDAFAVGHGHTSKYRDRNAPDTKHHHRGNFNAIVTKLKHNYCKELTSPHVYVQGCE